MLTSIYHKHIRKVYLAGLLLPCINRMLNNVNFTKRLEPARKDFELCKFQFQTAPKRLNTVLHLLELSVC